ncbi:MAG: hypothetical protein Q4A30_01730, partial [Candidatus Saccharibacteria bacterium]|nr:hypothetical protein [Candidatus Saccharibacteria bacterium]
MFKRKNLQGYNLSKKSYLKRRHLPRFLLGLLLAVTSTSALTIRHEITANGDIPFITTWRVSGDQAGRTVKIPTHSEPIKINQVSYNYTIDWGDGTGIETKTDNTVPVHTYAVDGDYQIKIRGTFPGWTFLNNNSHTITDEEHAIMAKKIIKLNQWGNIKW